GPDISIAAMSFGSVSIIFVLILLSHTMAGCAKAHGSNKDARRRQQFIKRFIASRLREQSCFGATKGFSVNDGYEDQPSKKCTPLRTQKTRPRKPSTL
ncbi:MAG: hypothetical protein ACR2OX_02740, partial [Methyloligellaceae bacterium]